MEIGDLIWRKILLPKHRLIAGLAAQGKLMAKDRLRTMGIQCADATCGLCDGGWSENIVHLFHDCVWTREMWVVMTQWTEIKVQL